MLESISCNVAEAIPYNNLKEMKYIVKQELKKGRYVEIWDEHVYSAKRWRGKDEEKGA